MNSGIFAPGSHQAQLLEYLFNKEVEGQAADLKEFTVAVELFHMSMDFDTHSNATVRVQAHRLRKKLESYYERIGRDHELRVVLPVGRYALEFQKAPAEKSLLAPASDTGTGVATAPRKKRKVLLWAALVVVVVLLALAGLQHARRNRPALNNVHSAAPGPETIAAPDPDPDAVRILIGHSGDPYVDNAGRRWGNDRFFEGGVVRKVDHEVLFRTSRPRLFQAVREGTSRYRIPLPPGEYEMHVYLTYPDVLGANLGPERQFRIMGIQHSGSQLLVLDLASEVGYNADVRSFAHLRPNDAGVLDVEFPSYRGPAAVTAIEILPMIQGRVRPVRIIAQSRPYLDAQGRLWLPDDYYSGGNFGDFAATINGDVDPGVVSHDRVGEFEYAIPVPEGEYRVTLYFGEGYFGPGQAGGGGVGSRVFNVLLNDEMLLRDFDILRHVPPLRLFTWNSRRVRPDKEGKIHLTFSPKATLASVRAIEVVPEE